jgi:uncharacterized protein (DUF1684 family)
MSRLVALVIVVASASCGASPARSDASTDVVSEWRAWRAERREELARPDGWLALVGLFWLEPGTHTIGSAADAAYVLPSGPPRLGEIVVADDVRFRSADGSVTALVADGDPIAIGSLRLLLIARGGRLALRVRDVDAPARATLGTLPAYDYDPMWRIRARVRAPEAGRMIALVNVLGMQVDEPCAAILDLSIAGAPISLVATSLGDRPGYFVMLRDATNEGETYGGGRYLEVAPADAHGETFVDMNFLYTPPCGYTSLATCPLPPRENVLATAIRAGERYDRHE